MPRNKDRPFAGTVTAALVAVALVSLAACAAPPTPAPLVRLRIGFAKAPTGLPYYVMQEQGFDKQNGLQFEELLQPTAPAMINALQAGSLDVCYVSTDGVLPAAENGLIPETIIPVAANSFADPEHPTTAVLVAPTISGWKDLEGRSIAVITKTSPTTAALKKRLLQEGVRNYTMVEVPIANMGLAVAGGNVAAATMLEPYLTQSLLRGDGKTLGWIVGGSPIERMEVTMIVFRGEFYRKNPQGVKAFLRAQLASLKWMSQNPSQTRSILVKRLDIAEEVGRKMTLPYWSLDARNDPALLEAIQPLLVEIGTVKAPIPARQLYDETLLDQVLAEKP